MSKNNELQELMDQDNVLRLMTPSHYTSILQLSGVGISKSSKNRLRNAASNWRRENQDALVTGEKIPAPKRNDVLLWLKTIWEPFLTENVHNSLTDSGYHFEGYGDYCRDAVSESEAE